MDRRWCRCTSLYSELPPYARRLFGRESGGPEGEARSPFGLPESLDPACSLAFRRSGAARGSGSVPRSSLTWGPRGTTLCPEG